MHENIEVILPITSISYQYYTIPLKTKQLVFILLYERHGKIFSDWKIKIISSDSVIMDLDEGYYAQHNILILWVVFFYQSRLSPQRPHRNGLQSSLLLLL